MYKGNFKNKHHSVYVNKDSVESTSYLHIHQCVSHSGLYLKKGVGNKIVFPNICYILTLRKLKRLKIKSKQPLCFCSVKYILFYYDIYITFSLALWPVLSKFHCMMILYIYDYLILNWTTYIALWSPVQLFQWLEQIIHYHHNHVNYFNTMQSQLYPLNNIIIIK